MDDFTLVGQVYLFIFSTFEIFEQLFLFQKKPDAVFVCL